MPQANVLRVGLLIGGALAIHSIVQADPGQYRPAPLSGGREWEPAGEGGRVVGTLLGPEETGAETFGFRFVRVFRPLGTWSALLAGEVLACGPVRPPYRIRVPVVCGVLVVWWWLWVGVRSCFENCIVNASI